MPPTSKSAEAVVRDMHTAFVCTVLGKKYVPTKEVQRLRDEGYAVDGKLTVDPATAGFIAGKLGVEVTDNTDAFWHAASKQLSDTDITRVDILRDRLRNFIEELGSKAAGKIGKAALDSQEADFAYVTSVVREAMADNAGFIERVRQVMHESKQDFARLLVTEMYNAVCSGKAASYVEQAGGDCLVYKKPAHDACAYCRYLYMVGNIPRIFWLSELTANGTNEGRRPKKAMLSGLKSHDDWRATLGSVHPFCKCSLHQVPKGHTFNEHGELVQGLPVIQHLDKSLLQHKCHGHGHG